MINFKFNLPVLLIVFFLLFSLSGIYYSPKTYLTFEDLCVEVLDPLKGDEENTYVIGCSRVRELGNPSIFYEKQPNIVNLGLNGSSFMTNFFVALYVLENKKPKNILFEITPYAGIHSFPASYKNFQLFDVFKATSLNYLDYMKIVDEFKKNNENSSRKDFFSHSNHFYDYIKTFNFLRYIKNINKEVMLEGLRNNIGNNSYLKDQFDSNISVEVFKSIGRFSFINNNSAVRPIEAYFIGYLNEIATKKKIDITYVVPLTLSKRSNEYEYYPTQLYHLGIKGMHKYDSLFLKSIYRKENFADNNHLNRKGMELFYNEVFN